MGTALDVGARSPRHQAFRTAYGPWAVITGASDGIGRELAWRVAARGVSVVLVARRRAVLTQLAEQLGAAHGVEARVVDVDLAQRGADEAVARAVSDLEVGLYVACAGFGTSGEFLASDLSAELDMIDVNCRALTGLAHRLGARMAERGRGGMVLMSSLLAFSGVPGAAGYAATKAYVQALAEGLHLELGPRGIDVLASAPGPIHSGFAARADMRMGMAQRPRDVADATLDALGRGITVRPGWLSKLLEASLATLPRQVRARILARVMHGMTRHRPALAPGA